MPAETKPVCVIPARGGSKRFRRKNLALFRAGHALRNPVVKARGY